MDVSTMKTPQLPLDFSLNVKADGLTNLNIQVKTAENGASMLISPDKNSQSAFKVVTPKHADGKSLSDYSNYLIRVFRDFFLSPTTNYNRKKKLLIIDKM